MLNDYLKEAEPLQNNGLPYIAFLEALHKNLTPRTYFEIGTETGKSVEVSSCPSICVDPEFRIERNIFKGRTQTLLFQKTSDDFFRDHDVRSIFPHGSDFAFLDGMHLFEFLFRDFTNTEKACHQRSLIALHDCLPLNARMAGRQVALGKEGEPWWDAWTGDVWKMIPVLKKYRPDLRVLFVDAPPTGLVLINNVDPKSSVLDNNYFSIVDEFSNLTLEEYGVEKLYHDFPTIDSKKLAAEFQAMAAFFIVK